MELARDLLAQTRATERPPDAGRLLGLLRPGAGRAGRPGAGRARQAGGRLAAGETGPAPAGEPAVLRAEPGPGGQRRGSCPPARPCASAASSRTPSAAAAHRVRLVLASPNLLFDESELVFGRLAPGESRPFELPVEIPRGSLTRTDMLRARVLAQTPIQANAAEMTLDIQGKPRPHFAFSYRTVDDGNRDGRIQRGEKVRLLVTVRNLGPGPALRTEALLRNRAGQPGILITAGQLPRPGAGAGAARELTFAYQVGTDFRGDALKLDLSVADPAAGRGGDRRGLGAAGARGPAAARREHHAARPRGERPDGDGRRQRAGDGPGDRRPARCATSSSGSTTATPGSRRARSSTSPTGAIRTALAFDERRAGPARQQPHPGLRARERPRDDGGEPGGAAEAPTASSRPAELPAHGVQVDRLGPGAAGAPLHPDLNRRSPHPGDRPGSRAHGLSEPGASGQGTPVALVGHRLQHLGQVHRLDQVVVEAGARASARGPGSWP